MEKHTRKCISQALFSIQSGQQKCTFVDFGGCFCITVVSQINIHCHMCWCAFCMCNRWKKFVLLVYMHICLRCVKCAWWCNVIIEVKTCVRADHRQMHQHPQKIAIHRVYAVAQFYATYEPMFNEFGITWAYFVHKKILSTRIRCWCSCCCRRISIFQPIKIQRSKKCKQINQTNKRNATPQLGGVYMFTFNCLV